jgi:hypothetical protein
MATHALANVAQSKNSERLVIIVSFPFGSALLRRCRI